MSAQRSPAVKRSEMFRKAHVSPRRTLTACNSMFSRPLMND
jgi:hypothetical protein